MVCIIDDREDVWNFAPNVIRVKPYNYFRNTGDINAPPNAVSKETKQAETTSTSTVQNSTTASNAAVSDNNKILVPEKDCKDPKEIEKQNGEESVSDSTNQKATTIDANTEEKKTEDVTGKDKKLEEKNDKPEGKDAADVAENPIITYWDAHHADDYLLYLEEILVSVHKTYYDMHNKMKKDKQKGIPDLKMVVPYVRSKVLNKTNIVFSSIIPTNCVPEGHYLWTLAESLGAQVTRELELEKSEQRTTHVVASKQGTVKVNLARRHKGMHIVSLDWLLCCADRWEHADERLFPLADGDASESDLNNSITAKARAKKFNSLKRKHDQEESKDEDDKFSERVFVEAGLSLSKEDIEDMDKEIDEACSDESVSGESDESSSSSSIESLSSGDYPKGWKKRKKVDVTAPEQDNETAETSDAETIGSVDEEMAEAVKQEFGNY